MAEIDGWKVVQNEAGDPEGSVVGHIMNAAMLGACLTSSGVKSPRKMDLWPWQNQFLAEVPAILEGGCQALAVTSPTGMGKGRMIAELARWRYQKGGRVLLYTNRRLLTGQSARVLEDSGILCGYIAAGFEANGNGNFHPDRLFTGDSVKVASVQTVRTRLKAEKISLPPAELVIIDEAHNKIFDPIVTQYRDEFTPVVGFTAVPVDLGKRYQRLLAYGTKKEGRAAGALVPCLVFAPHEPDMRGVRMARGEYLEGQMVKRVMETIVFGDVFQHWLRLNPQELPTLLWAPDRASSKYFVERFKMQGIRAEHMEGDTPDKERNDIIAASKAGECKIISSCGVLREGVDFPWIRHGVLIQVCGAISTYLQLVGRLLRAYPGKESAILQDHAGCWHRHGSPNADRIWTLDDTDLAIAQASRQARQEGAETEAIRCPQCGGIRGRGPECPHCGHRHTVSVRVVRTIDGKLKRMTGPTIRKRKQVSPEQRIWSGCLFAGARSGRTLAQAARIFWSKTDGLYVQDANVTPKPSQDSPDWDRRILNVYPWFGKRFKKAKV